MTERTNQGWLDDGLRGQIEDGQQGTPERTKDGSKKKRTDANWTNGDLVIAKRFRLTPAQMLAKRAKSIARIEALKEWVQQHPGEVIPEDHPLRTSASDAASSASTGPACREP